MSSKMEVKRDSELMGASQSLDIRGLLDLESEAYRNSDAPNMAAIYVVRKVPRPRRAPPAPPARGTTWRGCEWGEWEAVEGVMVE